MRNFVKVGLLSLFSAVVRLSQRQQRIVLLTSFSLPAFTLIHTVQATIAQGGESREPGVVRHTRLANHNQLIWS
jgi:hypothetical protein